MSQAEDEALSVLTEVGSWDAEMCRRQLPGALRRLMSMYQMSDSWTQHICILRILMERFLPHINLYEVEEAFFSKVLPKVTQLFDLLIYEISNYTNGITIQNVELHETLRKHLQGLVQVLEASTGCLQHVSTMQETVPLECVQNLPFSFLHIIKNTFIHCKNSELLYSGCIHLFSDLLQSLFKTAYALQKQLMGLFEVVSVNSCAAEDARTIIVSVIHTLLEICSTVSSIDHAVHANTWKFIVRQSFKHQSLIKTSLKHSDVVSGLCENILASFQSCLELAEQTEQTVAEESVDSKLFERTVKLCRFFANSLVHYTKEFTPFLVDSCFEVYHVFLQIYSQFPPSLYASVICQAHQEKIGGFLEILDTLLSQLLPFKPFQDLVLRKTSVSDLSPELRLPHCRLLLSVMDLLPSQSQDVQVFWNKGSQCPEDIASVPLVAALFLSLQHCSGELSLPVFLPAAAETRQAGDPLTFYHYACIHLCTFITSLSSSQFHLLECSLLEALLSSNMITSLLAMDVWCFLARYGTADLCTHHAFIIADLIKSCPAENYQVSMLGILLRRLLFLMAADHQMKFTQRFPPKEAENLLLWQHLSLQALVPLLRQQVAHEIFVAGFAQCQEWLSSKRFLEGLSQVNTALAALLSLCQTAEETLKVGQRTALIGVLAQFFAILDATQVSSLPCLQETVCLIFRLLQFFIHTLEPELLIQVFTLQSSLLQLNPQDYVLTAILDFLSSLGKLLLPPDFQVQILPKLSCLFASSLASSNWLIHQHAMEAFTRFAEETNHEGILPQCLPSEEIKGRVIGFLSKTQQTAETAEARTARMRKENNLLRCHFLEVTADAQKALISEPSPKRTCFSPSEEQYKLAVDNAEGSLEALKMMLQKGPPPTWLSKRLETLQMALESLRNSGDS